MDSIVSQLEQALSGIRVEPAPSVDRQTTVYVDAADVVPVMQALRDRPEFAFALLVELTAVDFMPREPRFEVVYVLVSIAYGARLRVKVRLPSDGARVATVSGIWPAANWLEREVWDLFGIEFDGHPDPRRLLMPEDWKGFPLRKDHPVQLRMTPRTSEPLQLSAEQFRANLEHDRLTRKS